MSPREEPPAEGSFTQALTVPASDIDLLGHASNLAYLRWVQDVAWAHSEALGWDHARYLELGAVFVVRRHELDYLRQVLEGDALTVLTWVSGWKAATCLRQTRIHRGEVLVASAVTTWALMGVADGRPRRIPPAIRDAFGA